MQKFILGLLLLGGLSFSAFADDQIPGQAGDDYIDIEESIEEDPGYDPDAPHPIFDTCNDPNQNFGFCNGVGLEPRSLFGTDYLGARGGWYCKKRPGLEKWRRCSYETGQCIPPDFDKLFQCENALP